MYLVLTLKKKKKSVYQSSLSEFFSFSSAGRRVMARDLLQRQQQRFPFWLLMLSFFDLRGRHSSRAASSVEGGIPRNN